jgi:hypothetical protein
MSPSISPRTQLCTRSCSNKHTHTLYTEVSVKGALEKPANPDGSPGGLRPIICGESWRRCLANLAAAAVRGPISKIFTSTYENFLQTAGLQDGASHCAKILSAMYASLNSELSGLKEGDNIETVCTELRNMFSYFKALGTNKSHLRYFDFCGNVLDAWGKTGGQQGDPLEMIGIY